VRGWIVRPQRPVPHSAFAGRRARPRIHGRKARWLPGLPDARPPARAVDSRMMHPARTCPPLGCPPCLRAQILSAECLSAAFSQATWVRAPVSPGRVPPHPRCGIVSISTQCEVEWCGWHRAHRTWRCHQALRAFGVPLPGVCPVM